MKKFSLALILITAFNIIANNVSRAEIGEFSHGVKSVTTDGVIFYEPYNGGSVRCYNTTTGQTVWIIDAYKVKNISRGQLQKCSDGKYDIFITFLEIKNGKLIVTNERKDIFVIDLKTKKVIPKNKVYRIDEYDACGIRKWWEFWKK